MKEDRVLIFDKWANEANCRVEVWRLPNGDVHIVFVDTGDAAPVAALTLASYRADDLRKSLESRMEADVDVVAIERQHRMLDQYYTVQIEAEMEQTIAELLTALRDLLIDFDALDKGNMGSALCSIGRARAVIAKVTDQEATNGN